MESLTENRQCIKSDHASYSASLQTEYLHEERSCFGASAKGNSNSLESTHHQMTAANLAIHDLCMARAPTDNTNQDIRRLLAAAKDLGFRDIAGWVVHEQKKVELAKGKSPMEKWLDSRDERLIPYRREHGNGS